MSSKSSCSSRRLRAAAPSIGYLDEVHGSDAQRSSSPARRPRKTSRKNKIPLTHRGKDLPKGIQNDEEMCKGFENLPWGIRLVTGNEEPPSCASEGFESTLDFSSNVDAGSSRRLPYPPSPSKSHKATRSVPRSLRGTRAASTSPAYLTRPLPVDACPPWQKLFVPGGTRAASHSPAHPFQFVSLELCSPSQTSLVALGTQDISELSPAFPTVPLEWSPSHSSLFAHPPNTPLSTDVAQRGTQTTWAATTSADSSRGPRRVMPLPWSYTPPPADGPPNILLPPNHYGPMQLPSIPSSMSGAASVGSSVQMDPGLDYLPYDLPMANFPSTFTATYGGEEGSVPFPSNNYLTSPRVTSFESFEAQAQDSSTTVFGNDAEFMAGAYGLSDSAPSLDPALQDWLLSQQSLSFNPGPFNPQ